MAFGLGLSKNLLPVVLEDAWTPGLDMQSSNKRGYVLDGPWFMSLLWAVVVILLSRDSPSSQGESVVGPPPQYFFFLTS